MKKFILSALLACSFSVILVLADSIELGTNSFTSAVVTNKIIEGESTYSRVGILDNSSMVLTDLGFKIDITNDAPVLTSGTNSFNLGSSDIDLSIYALNTNVVHASFGSTGEYFIEYSVIVNSGIIKVIDGDNFIYMAADEGFGFSIDGGRVNFRMPYEIGTNDGTIFDGEDVNGDSYIIWVPSDSNEKYLALTTNSTGHITYDEIAGAPDLDLSSVTNVVLDLLHEAISDGLIIHGTNYQLVISYPAE